MSGLPGAAVVGGGPARGGGHRDWPAPAPCAQGGGGGGGRAEGGGGGGTKRAARAAAAAAPRRRRWRAVRSPVQPWLSPRRAPAPPSASATRSPAQLQEPDLRPRRSRDRDPGRPAMTATEALLRVLLLLLATGHSTHGETPGGLARAPSGEACDAPPAAPCPARPVPSAPTPARLSRLTLSLARCLPYLPRHPCVPSPALGSPGGRGGVGPQPLSTLQKWRSEGCRCAD